MSFWPDTKFELGTTVMQRLGLVLNWSGCLIAALGLGMALIVAFGSKGSDAEIFVGLGAVTAVTAWLIGRALLFICAGR